MHKFLATAALSSTLAATVVGASAAQTPQASQRSPFGEAAVKVRVVVNATGLNLSDPAGAEVFVGRLNRAVNQACNDRSASSPTLTLGRSDGFQSCRAKALGEAMSRVDAPAVKDRIAQLMSHPATELARR